MSKADEKTTPPPAVAYYDFYKTNGTGPHKVFTTGPSLTRQEFAEECDINVLMSRFENRDIGSIMRAAQEPVYYDLTRAPRDLMSAMQLMEDARSAFMTLPAKVRREFDNDPVDFVEFAGNPANLDQMREWGLAPPKPQPPPAPAPVTPPASPAPSDKAAPKAAPTQ